MITIMITTTTIIIIVIIIITYSCILFYIYTYMYYINYIPLNVAWATSLNTPLLLDEQNLAYQPTCFTGDYDISHN
jgi:hypothetical protein